MPRPAREGQWTATIKSDGDVEPLTQRDVEAWPFGHTTMSHYRLAKRIRRTPQSLVKTIRRIQADRNRHLGPALTKTVQPNPHLAGRPQQHLMLNQDQCLAVVAFTESDGALAYQALKDEVVAAFRPVEIYTDEALLNDRFALQQRLIMKYQHDVKTLRGHRASLRNQLEVARRELEEARATTAKPAQKPAQPLPGVKPLYRYARPGWFSYQLCSELPREYASRGQHGEKMFKEMGLLDPQGTVTPLGQIYMQAKSGSRCFDMGLIEAMADEHNF